MSLPADVMRLEAFRRLLSELDPASFAALLRELATEAYNRNISRYGVLVDISNELLDAVTFAARVRIVDKWLATPDQTGSLPDRPSPAAIKGARKAAALPPKRGRRGRR